MLQMQGISKTFKTSHIETRAVGSLTLRVGKGEFVAVTGPSGAGKSTFLNIAGLLETYDKGTYLLDGEDVGGLSDDEASSLRNRKIGFVFQNFNLISDLNVYENVGIPLRYASIRPASRKPLIVEALSRVGLGSRMKHYPNELSGGQQQRVAIARALATRPGLILADEPTGNLDAGMSAEIMQILTEVNQAGTTIVMVSHNEQLAKLATRNVHIVDGIATDRITSERLAGIS